MTDTPRVELYRDEKGDYRWRALANNNEVVADGAEGFRSKQSAQENIALNYGQEAVVRDIALEP